MKHLEDNLQKACVTWFRLQYPHHRQMLFAVPNGGNRNAREAARLKAQGVTAGVSDLILLVSSSKHNSLCIELKIGKGKQSLNQIEWEKSAISHGNAYVICRTIDEFIEIINLYLNN